VKGGTNEGIVLLLSVMRPMTQTGLSNGLVGHVTVISVNWQQFADLMVSDSCKEDLADVQRLKDYLGTRLIFHTSMIAAGPDADGLAEMLIEGRVNKTIRETARKIRAFFEEVEKRKDEASKEVINPYR
jgi:hypothetical protein